MWRGITGNRLNPSAQQHLARVDPEWAADPGQLFFSQLDRINLDRSLGTSSLVIERAKQADTSKQVFQSCTATQFPAGSLDREIPGSMHRPLVRIAMQ